jgi:6-phosphogluconolactonase
MSDLSHESRHLEFAQTISWHEFADADDTAAQLAIEVGSHLRAGMAARGTASLIVSGGRSPIKFFAALSSSDLAWDRITIGLADERWVDPGSADSNEKLVRSHLLVGMAGNAAFIPLKTHASDPESALADRTQALLTMKRPFEVVVLGMGDDGHMASLFPGVTGLDNALDPSAEPALVAISPLAAPHRRISMNVSALLDTRQIILLIQGAKKRAVLDSALANTYLRSYPIAAILHQSRVPVAIYWSP